MAWGLQFGAGNERPPVEFNGSNASAKASRDGYAIRKYLNQAIAPLCCCIYNNHAVVTFDPGKRRQTLLERGVDFADAQLVFSGSCFEVEDVRKNYGETRIICFGMLHRRMVVVGYTPRGTDRHVFSMRKANDREKARIAPLLGL